MEKCLILAHSNSFTPDREAGGESALPHLGGVEGFSGVDRSGKTFNFLSFPRIPAVYGGLGCEVLAFAVTTGVIRRNDARDQRKAGAATAQWAVVAGTSRLSPSQRR